MEVLDPLDYHRESTVCLTYRQYRYYNIIVIIIGSMEELKSISYRRLFNKNKSNQILKILIFIKFIRPLKIVIILVSLQTEWTNITQDNIYLKSINFFRRMLIESLRSNHN